MTLLPQPPTCLGLGMYARLPSRDSKSGSQEVSPKCLCAAAEDAAPPGDTGPGPGTLVTVTQKMSQEKKNKDGLDLSLSAKALASNPRIAKEREGWGAWGTCAGTSQGLRAPLPHAGGRAGGGGEGPTAADAKLIRLLMAVATCRVGTGPSTAHLHQQGPRSWGTPPGLPPHPVHAGL